MALCFFGGLPSGSASPLLRKKCMDTAKGYRLSSQVSSSKEDNAPDGAITKSLRSGTLLAPKEYPEKCRCSACSGPTRLAGRPGRRGRFALACSSLRPSERKKQSVRLHGLTSAANRPPPPHGRARVGAVSLARADAVPFSGACQVGQHPFCYASLRKEWDTAFDCRLSSQAPSS